MVADPRPPSSASAVLSRTHEPPAHSNSSSNRNSNRNSNSHSLVEHSADDRAARTLLSLLKGTAMHPLVPRTTVWDLIKQGLRGSQLGEELGQYIDAVESRNASQAAGSSTTRLFKTDEEAAEEIGSLQTRLEAEKRSHKILKRDMVALESSYTTVLANLKSLNLTIHRLEEQCLAQANETEEAELKAAAVAHDLKVTKEALEQARSDYKMLSETFAKASESHQKSLQHLKHSLEATEQAKEIVSSRASQPDASIGANTISRLEANLVLEREKYAADMSLLRKINDDIQAQLNKAVHNYNTLASSTRSEDDWLALTKKLRAAEKRAHECASKLQFATESLEISAKKYGIVSEEYDTLNKETRTLRESCARLKSVISAKDAIIDDMYAKHATLVTENSDLQARTKSASATATNKKNLLQDYKTKLDALVAKISPLQELASQAQALRDTNRRLKVEGKIKEERVAEMRKRYEELDAFLKESAKVKETLDTDLEGKAAREVSRLRQKLATRECRLAALERAVRKCAGLLVARYRGLKGARVADEKVERLAREFFGVGVVGIVAGTINTIESLEGGIDAVLEGSDIEGGLVQLLRDALDRVPIGIQI